MRMEGNVGASNERQQQRRSDGFDDEQDDFRARESESLY